MPVSTISSKGQTTIPKRIREHLQLNTGDRLEFIIEPGGQVIVRPATLDLSALDGLLDRSGTRPISVEDMHSAVEKAVCQPIREIS